MAKPNQTPRHREQSSHCWRDRGDKEAKMGEEDQRYGDREKLNFWQ